MQSVERRKRGGVKNRERAGEGVETDFGSRLQELKRGQLLLMLFTVTWNISTKIKENTWHFESFDQTTVIPQSRSFHCAPLPLTSHPHRASKTSHPPPPSIEACPSLGHVHSVLLLLYALISTVGGTKRATKRITTLGPCTRPHSSITITVETHPSPSPLCDPSHCEDSSYSICKRMEVVLRCTGDGSNR